MINGSDTDFSEFKLMVTNANGTSSGVLFVDTTGASQMAQASQVIFDQMGSGCDNRPASATL
jgi:hypothetical protein